MRSWRVWLVAANAALWSLNQFIEPGAAFIRTIGLTGTYLGSGGFLVAAYNTHAADLGRGKITRRRSWAVLLKNSRCAQTWALVT